MEQPIYEKYGLTEAEWNQLPIEDIEKITGMDWTTKPCDICNKPTPVTTAHKGRAWCMEHGGKWRKEGK